MSKLNYLTEDGLKKLKEELNHLKTVERPKASQAIADARDKGDLSENAEYDAAKEAQGLLELKISKMEELVQNSRVIDESKIDYSKVQIMTKVKIRNTKNKAEMQYSIVSESEADLKKGKIAVNTPIAKGLLGKTVGEKTIVQAPAGNMEFEILEISPMT
ncbi:transcription elongation factor GreA [Salinivirga cyanobacteriivorans]|uniref:Transcription elongation factor GreA n=1 Tax=Salinivirga cyanobacteriivorans TaxID=1307839 RepID=A0A0S2I111_9BACT|nr:transcription elongation factor GreA [Salinivirga cyanobacteriivorans]ALO16067.1 Transcript cleavage factor GreA [Salinivirga cyanobacteriivorans]